jgi:MFS family permease
VVPAFIADAVPDEVRGIGIGTFRTFMDMGGLIGPVVMSTLADTVGGVTGYLYTFYFGIIMILGLIGVTMTLKNTTAKTAVAVH